MSYCKRASIGYGVLCGNDYHLARPSLRLRAEAFIDLMGDTIVMHDHPVVPVHNHGGTFGMLGVVEALDPLCGFWSCGEYLVLLTLV